MAKAERGKKTVRTSKDDLGFAEGSPEAIALAAKNKFAAKLMSVDPALVDAFYEFLNDFAAPRRALVAKLAELDKKYGDDE